MFLFDLQSLIKSDSKQSNIIEITVKSRRKCLEIDILKISWVIIEIQASLIQ